MPESLTDFRELNDQIGKTHCSAKLVLHTVITIICSSLTTPPQDVCHLFFAAMLLFILCLQIYQTKILAQALPCFFICNNHAQ